VTFLAFGSVENSLDNVTIGTLPIGRPDNRFGFDQVFATTAAPPARNGAPREYDSKGAFFGRYTEEETSNALFQFPGALSLLGGTPVSPVGYATALTLDPTAFTMSLGNPAQVSFAGGSRRGEDILLTNVVSFDVKFWDNLYSEDTNQNGVQDPGEWDVNRNGVFDTGPAFADVGHSAPFGSFRGAGSPNPFGSANVFPQYGPNPNTAGSTNYTNNNVFDTWFRRFHFDNVCRNYDVNNTGVLFAPAPYRPRLGVIWKPNTQYAVGALIDPVDTTGNLFQANGYIYKCVVAGWSGATPPTFSLSDAVRLNPTTIVDTATAPNTPAQWQPQAPLNVQAIQITVKYLDPTQNLLRQVTIVQSLTQ
jgi:hypothetical protein